MDAPFTVGESSPEARMTMRARETLLIRCFPLTLEIRFDSLNGTVRVRTSARARDIAMYSRARARVEPWSRS